MKIKYKILSFLLALVFLIPNMSVAAQDTTSELLSEGFEYMTAGEKPDYPWSIALGDAQSPVTVENAENNNFARFHTNGKHYSEMSYMFSKNVTNELILEFKIRKSSVGTTARIGFYADGKFNNNIEFYYDSNITVINGKKTVSLKKYELNRWYDMKIVINPKTKKYDICLDGELIADSFELPVYDWHVDNSVSMNYENGINGILLASYSTTGAVGTMDIDDVKCRVKKSAETYTYIDVSDEKTERYLKFLGNLNILKGYDNGLFLPKDFVTRAELCTIIRRLSNLPSVGGTDNTGIFNDVSFNYWALDDIAFAYKMGYISGYTDGSFRPDSPIKTEEALKILIKLINYDVFAEAQGGYPAGYRAVATERGLLKNTSIDTAYLLREDLAVILYNLLQLPLMKQVSFGDEIQYDLSYDENLLSENFKTRRGVGILTDNGFSGITDDTAIGLGRIMIDNTIYNVSDNREYINLIGKNIEFFYKTEDDESEIIFMSEYNNESFLLESCYVNGYNGEYLFYDDDSGKESKIPVNGKIPIIYNNKYIDNYTSSYLTDSYGTLEFTDNNRDGAYDIIYIKNYRNIKVSTVSNDTIYGKYDKTPVMLNSSDIYCNVYINKELIDLKNIKSGSVISVAESEDGKFFEIHCCDSIISGKLEAKDDEGFVIDGIHYRTAPELAKYDSTVIGAKGSWSKDVLGNLTFGIETVDGNVMKYGYLSGYRVNEYSDSKVKLFTENGIMEEFIIRENVIVKNEKISDFHVLDTLLSENSGYVIGYRTNTEDEITHFIFPSVGSDSNSLHFDEYNSAAGVISPVRQKLYCGTLKALNATTYFNNDTKFLIIPESDKTNDSKYSLEAINYFVTDEKYDYISYSTGNDSLTSDIVVVYSAANEKLRIDDPVLLIEKRVTAIDSEKVARSKVYGYLNGEYSSFFFDEGINSGDFLEHGDIIRVRVNSYNEISDVQWILDANGNVAFDTSGLPTGFKSEKTDEPVMLVANPSKALTEIRERFVYGGLYEKEPAEQLLKLFTNPANPNDREKHEIHRLSKTSKILYTNGHNIKTASEDELVDYLSSNTDYSKVFIYTYYRNPLLIVVYGGD